MRNYPRVLALGVFSACVFGACMMIVLACFYISGCSSPTRVTPSAMSFTRILPPERSEPGCKVGEVRFWSSLTGYGCEKPLKPLQP